MDMSIDASRGGGAIHPSSSLPSVRRGLLVAIFLLSSSLSFAESTFVAMAAPWISYSLHPTFEGADIFLVKPVNPELIFAIMLSYPLAMGVLWSAGARLVDRFGPRWMFAVGMVGFSAGSILCATANSPLPLIAGRLLQGACAGLSIPAVVAGLMHAFPGRWPRWFARLTGAVMALATIVGPVVAVVTMSVTQAPNWRLVFQLTAAVGLIGLAGTLVVPRSANPRSLSDSGQQPNGARPFTWSMLGTDPALLTRLILGGLCYAVVVGGPYVFSLGWIEGRSHNSVPAGPGLGGTSSGGDWPGHPDAVDPGTWWSPRYVIWLSILLAAIAAASFVARRVDRWGWKSSVFTICTLVVAGCATTFSAIDYFEDEVANRPDDPGSFLLTVAVATIVACLGIGASVGFFSDIGPGIAGRSVSRTAGYAIAKLSAVQQLIGVAGGTLILSTYFISDRQVLGAVMTIFLITLSAAIGRAALFALLKGVTRSTAERGT